jgi:hypothetical protein
MLSPRTPERQAIPLACPHKRSSFSYAFLKPFVLNLFSILTRNGSFGPHNAAEAVVRYKTTELTLQDDPFDVSLILGQHSQTIC